VVLLAGTPVKEWFEGRNISPTQDKFVGHSGDGRWAMCLLAALAFEKLGRDSRALYDAMNRRGTGALYRVTERVLADVIGVDRRDALFLESGWTGRRTNREVAEARGLPTVLWDLGHDAWEQAKEARFGHEGPPGALGAEGGG
jgi:hypothetical protein